ncbi:MAG: WYL domain-containing protein [Ruminococcaceae bacterium]|nr:WYL domain-containing protein [Oscillospiraceae bacterium]
MNNTNFLPAAPPQRSGKPSKTKTAAKGQTAASSKLPTITIYDLLRYMLENSSAEHRLSLKEISADMTAIAEYCAQSKCTFEDLTADNYAQIKNMRGSLVKKDASQNNSSISRQISRLLNTYCNRDIIFENMGIYGSKTPDSPNFDSKEKVFYASALFDNTQINLLRDSLTVFSYAETKETAKIIERLNQLTDIYNREKYDPTLVDAAKYPGSYYKNLREITKAFAKIKPVAKDTKLTSEELNMTNEEYERTYLKKTNKIRFRYCAYNEKKELEVRPGRDGSEYRVVNPIKLMWANGYYYLVVYNPDDSRRAELINYRVDRMRDVECLEEEAQLPVDFSPSVYKKENPIMYTDRIKYPKIVIRCKRSLINNALDTFGFDIEIKPLPDGEEAEITLTRTSAEGVKMWALEYGFGAEVISPKEVRDSLAEAANSLAEKYVKSQK